MILRLLLAFTLIPLIELYLLLKLAEATSAGVTFLLVIATGVLGSMLARREGVLAWNRFRNALSESRVPNQEIQDGVMIVFAAALLLTPGILTDVLGFTMLIPAGRALLRRYVFSRFFGRLQMRVNTFGNSGDRWSSDSSATESLHRKRRDDSKTIDATAFERKPLDNGPLGAGSGLDSEGSF